MEHEVTLSGSMESDGFVVARNVLSRDEIALLRAQVDGVLDDRGIELAGGTVLPNAAVGAPELAWLFSDPRLIELVARVLGSGDVMFTYEADLHRNFLASSWHRDTGEGHMPGGYFGVDPLGRQDCRIVKLALYLQDHVSGGGLHLRPGSHRCKVVDGLPEHDVASCAGDVVIFDVRMSHRGARPRPTDQVLRAVAKLPSRSGRPRSADAYRRRFNAALHRPDRLVVYFAFGLANDNSESFATRNMRRQLEDLGQTTTELPEELRVGLEAAGVKIACI
jgi:hypothetical protein